jgi:ribosomal protein L44E
MGIFDFLSRPSYKSGPTWDPRKFHQMRCTTCSGHAEMELQVTNQAWLSLKCSQCGKAETIGVE